MSVTFSLQLPGELASFRLPVAVNRRLAELLDMQDGGQTLSEQDKAEAEGLIDLAELLSLLQLKAQSA